MNTSSIYIHRYPCHGNHHFPTETIYGESSYEGSICNRMLSESDPMLNLFRCLILTHIIWAVKISLPLVLRILRERMESLDVSPPFSSSFLLPSSVTCLLVSGLLVVEWISKVKAQRSQLLGGWNTWCHSHLLLWPVQALYHKLLLVCWKNYGGVSVSFNGPLDTAWSHLRGKPQEGLPRSR